MYRRFIEEYLSYKDDSEIHKLYVHNNKILKRLILETYIIAFLLLAILFYYLVFNKGQNKYILVLISIPLIYFFHRIIIYNRSNRALMSCDEYNNYLRKRIMYSIKKAQIHNTDNLLRIIEKDYSSRINDNNNTSYSKILYDLVKLIIPIVVSMIVSSNVDFEQALSLMIVCFIVILVIFIKIVVDAILNIYKIYDKNNITGQELKEIYENLGLC